MHRNRAHQLHTQSPIKASNAKLTEAFLDKHRGRFRRNLQTFTLHHGFDDVDWEHDDPRDSTGQSAAANGDPRFRTVVAVSGPEELEGLVDCKVDAGAKDVHWGVVAVSSVEACEAFLFDDVAEPAEHVFRGCVGYEFCCCVGYQGGRSVYFLELALDLDEFNWRC